MSYHEDSFEYTAMSASIESTLTFLGAGSVAGRLPRSARSAGATWRDIAVRIAAAEAPIQLKTIAVDRLSEQLGVARSRVLEIAGIPVSTFSRRHTAGQPLAVEESDRVLRLARLIHETERVFGDAAKARRWLQSPSAGLRLRVPLELLATDAGAQDVQAELIRIDYGDFA